jgi:hypothetical protein
LFRQNGALNNITGIATSLTEYVDNTYNDFNLLFQGGAFYLSLKR